MALPPRREPGWIEGFTTKDHQSKRQGASRRRSEAFLAGQHIESRRGLIENGNPLLPQQLKEVGGRAARLI